MVFRLWTPSVPVGADLGGAGGGLKDQEAGRRPEGKDAGASQQQAALQPWQVQRPVQRLHLQQHMLRMVTASLKEASRHPAPFTTRWVDPAPAPPSTPAEAPPLRPKEARPPRAPTSSWLTATNTAAKGRSGKARAVPAVQGPGDALITHVNVPSHTHCDTRPPAPQASPVLTLRNREIVILSQHISAGFASDAHSFTVSTSFHMPQFSFRLSVSGAGGQLAKSTSRIVTRVIFRKTDEGRKVVLIREGELLDLLSKLGCRQTDMNRHKQHKRALKKNKTNPSDPPEHEDKGVSVEHTEPRLPFSDF